MSKKCTPLWREDARSTFASAKAKNTARSDHFWKLRCLKSARRCGAKHISKSKFKKHTPAPDHFWTFRCSFAWQAQGIVHLVKSEQNWGFCSISKNDGRRGTFEEDLQSCIFRGRRSTSDIFIGAVRRALISWDGLHFGASDLQFWEDDFAWQAKHFVGPGITFSWQAQYFRQVEWKNRKTHWHEAVSSALSFPFLKDVSQNGFVFDVVKFKNWGSLAEFFVLDVVKFKNWRNVAK